MELVGPDGLVVARGLVNYDSDELPALLGRSTRDLAAELVPGTTARSCIATRSSSSRAPRQSLNRAEAHAAGVGSRRIPSAMRKQHKERVRHDGGHHDELFFDQFDSQVGVIGILAGPAGVREVGWRLRPQGASTEPDETVQMALGQLREYFAGQRRDFTLPLDLPPMEPVTEAVLQALRTVGCRETITYGELAKLSGTGVPARAIGRSWRPTRCRSSSRAIGWWPAMASADTPAVSRAASWRPSVGCWRTRARCRRRWSRC